MDLQTILDSPNVAEELDEEKLRKISSELIAGFEADCRSRSEWEERNKEAMKLALQVSEDKTTPWKNAANVKFPLITTAAIQFSSRTYPAMVSGTEVVKCKAYGDDPDGEKNKRAQRVSKHMSYQVLEEDEGWEEDFDKMLLSLPIMGCGFKKTYFDSSLGHNVSSNVFPKHLVVDYYARSLETAKRVTHILQYYKNEIIEKQRLGYYVEKDLSDGPQLSDEQSDQRQGVHAADSEAAHELLEIHTWLDLDEDGYEEPYVVTIHKESTHVCRIVPRFSQESVTFASDGRVGKIIPDHYFTKFSFIPSPDGGFYDLGFGALLGPITESINTLINQLIDSGTLANMPSGFIGRGARMKGGEYRFKGGEFKQLNATGDDLRKNIFMLPIKEPSQTLFQLLGLLIEYGERISGVSDMMSGVTPGQNTPATTAMAALEQGQKVFTGIHKRIYRALREEFRKLYRLNSVYLEKQNYFQFFDGDQAVAYQDDYKGDPTDIKPSADPNVSSTQQRIAKAQLVKENAMSGMAAYNGYEVDKRLLEAAEVPDIESILPDPEGQNAIQPPEDPKIEIESAKFQADQEHRAEELRIKAMVADADIAAKETQALLNIAKAEAAEDGTQIQIYQTELNKIKEKRELLKAIIDAKNNEGRLRGMEGQSGNTGNP